MTDGPGFHAAEHAEERALLGASEANPAASPAADGMRSLTMPTCWVVQWVSELLPKEQWHRDRYWPFVEVYMSWGDAFRRAGELIDMGNPSAHWREVSLHSVDNPLEHGSHND